MVAERPLRPRPLRLFVFWTAVALFFSTQRYFAMGGGTEALLVSLRSSLPQWYAWGLLSPLVVRADRWAKRQTPGLDGRLVRHVPLALGIVSLYIVTRALADRLIGNPGVDWTFATLAPQYHWNLLIYSVMVAALVAYDAHNEARERALRASKLEARLSEARLQALKAQLRPHFLFNTLNAISAFMEDDPKTARRMTAHLGDLLRSSIEHDNRSEVTLREELGMVDDYLAIQQIRFAERLTVEREIDRELLSALVPALLLQPLVENAIEHGLGNKDEKGTLRLTATRRGETLELSVSDDGKGLVPRPGENGHGVGLRNTRDRLAALYGDEAELAIANGTADGVTVSVRLPLRVESPEEERADG